MEAKLADDDESLDDAATRAFGQIADKGYAADLHARGVSRIACYGAAFRGKDSRVAMEVLTG